MYDYLEQVTADVRDYVEQEIDLSEWAGDRDGLEEKLNDDLWTCDSVTGLIIATPGKQKKHYRTTGIY